MVRILIILFASYLFISHDAFGQNLPEVDLKLKAELKNYIRNHYMTPEEYIISKFKEHDIIFVGEHGYIKHDVELIQNLIPLLYRNGVFVLGTEFARREDQYLIDSLLNSTIYDEKLARLITFQFYVHKGFQEYVDIYKAAWELNHNMPNGSRKFRIIGLNDSPDWSFVKTPEDRDKGSVMRKVWQGGGEHLWAKTILDTVFAKGEKALIYSGMHHAFTEYKQPIYFQHKFIRFEDTRMGNHVFREIGKRAITICLHHPWVNVEGYDKPRVYPVDGIIDAVMEKMEPQYQRAGFDTKGTPFGKLTGETSFYKHGYTNFTLEMFCDGYIYQKPFSKYEGVTPIKEFVNETNIDQARAQSPEPSFRTASIEDFDQDAIRTADMIKRFPGGK